MLKLFMEGRLVISKREYSFTNGCNFLYVTHFMNIRIIFFQGGSCAKDNLIQWTGAVYTEKLRI